MCAPRNDEPPQKLALLRRLGGVAGELVGLGYVDRAVTGVGATDGLQPWGVGKLALHAALEGELGCVALTLGVDQDDLTRADLAVEHLLGEHVLDLTLDRTTQRARPEHRIEPTLSEEILGALGEL